MALSVLKNTNNETIIKISGIGTETISLQNDILSNTQALDNNSNQVVNIAGLEYTGLTGSVITIIRNGEVVMSLHAEGHDVIGLASGFGYVDTTENTSDIEVNIANENAQCYLTLRKASGYKTTVENATYGSYDDPTIVGAAARSGAPAPEGLFDLPIPGSGSYEFENEVDSTEGPLTNWSGNVSSISNEAPGLWRKKFLGNFGTGPNSAIDVNFCRDNPGYFGKADTFVGFGNQNLDSENNYTLEWVGYFKAPSTDTYNFHITCDDDTYLWLGEAALAGENGDGNAALVVSNETYSKTPNSVAMVEGQYYPVRIQFGEYSGAERMQIFWSNSNSASYGYSGASTLVPQVWFHDSVTKGHSA